MNTLRNTAILLVLAASFYSCQKNEVDNGSLKIGTITEIKLGETAENAKYGLSLSVENVKDERCPIPMLCIVNSSASVQFSLKTKNDVYNFTLYTYRGNFDNFFYYDEGIVVEGIKYQLADVLPYPVFYDPFNNDGHLEEQPVKTVIVLVGAHSKLSDTQWKFIGYQIKETSEVKTYPQDIEPIIIRFKKDFTVELHCPCNESQGTYIAGNDGNIGFKINVEEWKHCGEPVDDWERWVFDTINWSERYTIVNSHLTIENYQRKLYFQRI